ncbi:MAG: alpha/beta hydrolase [Anaerolineales bacterium]|nr:alpha/beta hydrolase [Anaerolineales bacterium]
MQQVTSKDGTMIGYLKKGAGPALLLVHGATADHTRWLPLMPRLEPHFTVFAMDRRGRGGSTDSPVYSLQREAEDVASMVEGIGEPVSILGHSFGALCSLEAALLTDKINQLILYEPPLPPDLPPVPTDVIDRIQALVDGGELEAGLEMFFREIVKMPEYELKDYRQLPVWQTRISLAPTIARELGIGRTYRFVPEKFAGVQVPTVLLLGGDSPDKVKAGVELVDSALPNSQVVILPGQQHIAMDVDPKLFVKEVLRFLLE